MAPVSPPRYDGESDVMAVLVGSGIVLIQACALFPGLLPFLLLLFAFALPLVVLGAVAAILVGIPLGVWRIARAVAHFAAPSV
jgi:hypothetical protein